jgi:hypothetical protein
MSYGFPHLHSSLFMGWLDPVVALITLSHQRHLTFLHFPSVAQAAMNRHEPP